MPDAKCPRCGGPAIKLLFTSSYPCDCTGEAELPRDVSGPAGSLRWSHRIELPNGCLMETYQLVGITPAGHRMPLEEVLDQFGLPKRGTPHPSRRTLKLTGTDVYHDPLGVGLFYT